MASVEKRQTSKGAASYIVKWRTPDGKHRTPWRTCQLRRPRPGWS